MNGREEVDKTVLGKVKDGESRCQFTRIRISSPMGMRLGQTASRLRSDALVSEQRRKVESWLTNNVALLQKKKINKFEEQTRGICVRSVLATI